VSSRSRALLRLLSAALRTPSLRSAILFISYYDIMYHRCLLRENWSAELVPTEPVSSSSSLSAPIWKAGRLPYSPGKPLENCPRGVFSQLLLAALRAAVPFLKRSEKSATESRPRVVQREILVRGATAKGQKAFSKETGYFSKASNGSRPTSPMLVCELQGVKRHSPSAWHTVLETS